MGQVEELLKQSSEIVLLLIRRTAEGKIIWSEDNSDDMINAIKNELRECEVLSGSIYSMALGEHHLRIYQFVEMRKELPGIKAIPVINYRLEYYDPVSLMTKIPLYFTSSIKDLYVTISRRTVSLESLLSDLATETK